MLNNLPLRSMVVVPSKSLRASRVLAVPPSGVLLASICAKRIDPLPGAIIHRSSMIWLSKSPFMPLNDMAKRLGASSCTSSSSDAFFTPEKASSGHWKLPLTCVRSPLTENSVFISCQRIVTSSSPSSPAGTISFMLWLPVRPCTVVSVGACALASRVPAFASRPSSAKRDSTTAAANVPPARGPWRTALFTTTRKGWGAGSPASAEAGGVHCKTSLACDVKNPF